MTADPDANRPGRFRWRVIPAVFLFVFGGVLVLGGVLALCVAVFAAFHPGAPPGAAVRSAGQASSVFSGLLWLLAGRWCLRGRWWRAVLAAVLGYAYMVAVFSAFGGD